MTILHDADVIQLIAQLERMRSAAAICAKE